MIPKPSEGKVRAKYGNRKDQYQSPSTSSPSRLLTDSVVRASQIEPLADNYDINSQQRKLSRSNLKGQFGKFLNQREDSVTHVSAYDDMNIISHHAVNNHYSDINNQIGRGYAKQTGNTLEATSHSKMTSNEYLPTDDYSTSRNINHQTLDNRLN